jgi:hypothetical protein
MTDAPAKNPCGTCPYRRDVPSGVWAAEEYAKLPPYDNDTSAQPLGVFHCHQQDGRICAGWAGTHDMNQSLALRLAASTRNLAPEVVEAVLDYTTEVPLFDTGAEAAEHGLAEVDEPGEKARKKIDHLTRRLQGHTT